MLPVPADWSLAFFRRAAYVPYSTPNSQRRVSQGTHRCGPSMPRLSAIPSIRPIRAAILLGIVTGLLVKLGGEVPDGRRGTKEKHRLACPALTLPGRNDSNACLCVKIHRCTKLGVSLVIT
jgi:hypothetical protein